MSKLEELCRELVANITNKDDYEYHMARLDAAVAEGIPVTIAIKGGAAHLVSPAGAKVTVLDYDVDGVDESRLEEDDEGDKFERIEVWA